MNILFQQGPDEKRLWKNTDMFVPSVAKETENYFHKGLRLFITDALFARVNPFL